jgi:superfamily II DNA/RNA helicase
MARGYKAPSNYEPRKKKGGKFAASKFGAAKGGAAKGSTGKGSTGKGGAGKGGRPEPAARPKATPPEPRGAAAKRGDAKRTNARNSDTRNARATDTKRGNTQHTDTNHTPDRRAPRLESDRVYPPLEARAITAAEAEGITFADLGLGPRIIRELAKQGAETPYPLQVATIPDSLAGRNVLGRGRTGSGKTIAFGAALVERLYLLRGNRGRAEGRAPQALVIAPTRELALQIDRTIQPLARAIGLFTTQLYGGVPASAQRAGLKRGVDIVIGTPGRLNDLADRGALDLSQIVITVLDEADIMSDMGFIEQVNSILFRTRPSGQRMLFSATLDSQVRGLVERYLPDPAVYEVADDRAAIDHRILAVRRDDKDAVAAELAGAGGRVLVFVRTKLGADRLVDAFAEHGVASLALHGDLSQEARTANLRKFQAGKVDVLIATDVAARGIHVDDIDLVVQFDPPTGPKTYVHRAGRTGRADARGTVVTLVTPSHRDRMRGLLAEVGLDAPVVAATPGGPELAEFAASGAPETAAPETQADS